MENKNKVLEKYAKQEMKTITDEIKSVSKENSEIISSKKDVEKNNDSLEEFVKQEITNLHSDPDNVEVDTKNLKESLTVLENNPKTKSMTV